MEQPTIFEDNFGTEFRIRRRSLLPVFLKVYIWIGFVVAMISFVAILFALGFSQLILGAFGQNYLAMVGLVGMAALFSAIIFSMTASLWFEVKWAIRYNWIMGAIWLVMLGVGFFTGDTKNSQINGLVLTIPYWIMIYKIQYRWEQEAVSKRELKMKTN
ncbi:hypothetical protein [Chitinophaga sp. LS1]|uniref:hypothetical protein n=1 Tax=Chitinophaga sp. LS1 TaxID=3051176 RepID=UPI002AAC0735|nr:hypothetical protein [Chitinophaga sp. LS1]WPV67754.1 hypothetical protein QQL36_03310 [Chitinophaga sp. LS1]